MKKFVLSIIGFGVLFGLQNAIADKYIYSCPTLTAEKSYVEGDIVEGKLVIVGEKDNRQQETTAKWTVNTAGSGSVMVGADHTWNKVSTIQKAFIFELYCSTIDSGIYFFDSKYKYGVEVTVPQADNVIFKSCDQDLANLEITCTSN